MLHRPVAKKTFLLVAAILFSIRYAWAVEPDPFELHAVIRTPGDHTREYTLARRGADSPETLFLDTTVLLDHTSLLHASVDEGQSEPMILIKLTSEGTKRFGEISTNYLNKRVAFVLNGQLCCAPVIRSPMFGGSVLISGNFSADEAKDLVEKLNHSVSP